MLQASPTFAGPVQLHQPEAEDGGDPDASQDAVSNDDQLLGGHNGGAAWQAHCEHKLEGGKAPAGGQAHIALE
jgi:hypothetical protein